MNTSFLLKRMVHLDYRRALQTVTAIASQSNTTAKAIAWDMLKCAVKYGAGPMDYQLFEFEHKSDAQRSSFITRGISTDLVHRLNGKKYRKYLDHKSLQDSCFSDFLSRDWLSTQAMNFESFLSFCIKHSRFLYKPDSGSCGKGILIFDTADHSPIALYNEIKKLAPGVLEEILLQHPDLEKLHPESVNTVRVVTITKNGVCNIVGAYLRMGRDEKYVDNLNSGGISARIEAESGQIKYPASDRMGHIFSSHPETHTAIQGFTIPHWSKIIALCNQLCTVIPELRYVGWDIAVRKDDVVFIEGNWLPGHDIMQLPAYCPKGFGVYPKIKRTIG